MDTLSLYLVAIIGTVIHIAFKYRIALNEQGTIAKANKKFKWSIELINSTINLLVIWALIFIKVDIEAILPLTTVSVLLYTYAGDSAIKHLLDIVSVKQEKKAE